MVNKHALSHFADSVCLLTWNTLYWFRPLPNDECHPNGIKTVSPFDPCSFFIPLRCSFCCCCCCYCSCFKWHALHVVSKLAWPSIKDFPFFVSNFSFAGLWDSVTVIDTNRRQKCLLFTSSSSYSLDCQLHWFGHYVCANQKQNVYNCRRREKRLMRKGSKKRSGANNTRWLYSNGIEFWLSSGIHYWNWMGLTLAKKQHIHVHFCCV